ncbi:uncharacterized protein METZ01_LOCUS480440, partial [marine metagenome]
MYSFFVTHRPKRLNYNALPQEVKTMPEEGLPSGEGRVHGIDAEGIDTDEWNQLMRHLEATIPVYDKVNSIVTLGQDSRWRRHVAKSANPGMKVLEVGCGPGTFAERLAGVDLTCLDPSAEMLAVAKNRVGAARSARSEAP